MSDTIEIAYRIEQQTIEHNRVNPTERWANCVYVSADVLDRLKAANTFFRALPALPGVFKVAGLTVIQVAFYRTVFHDEIAQAQDYIHVAYNPEFDR